MLDIKKPEAGKAMGWPRNPRKGTYTQARRQKLTRAFGHVTALLQAMRDL